MPQGMIQASTLVDWAKERREKLLAPMEQALHDGLTANKTTYATHKGKITDQREDVDHMARLRAAELTANVLGLKQSQDKPTISVQLNIVTPDWAIGNLRTPQTAEALDQVEYLEGGGGVKTDGSEGV